MLLHSCLAYQERWQPEGLTERFYPASCLHNLHQKGERCMAEQAGNSDLILENREKLTVTGVRRVLQCNAESAAIETARGVLQLAGAQLNVTGRIDTVEYTAARTPGGFLSRLLR